MKFEVIKQSHLKRNIIIGVVAVLIISALILNFTKAKYRVTESIPLVNGTINYTPYDFKVIAMYQENESGEYVDVDIMPSSGYVINEEMSYCTTDNQTKDTNAVLKTIDGYHTFSGLSKNSKCYLYFDEYKISTKDYILTNFPTILTRNNFNTAVTNTTTGTIYKSLDDTQYDEDGEVYYFAGAPTDNWVYFANIYWRILRINGNGTIRLIYNGTSNVTKGTSTQIGTSAFNSSAYDNMYLGYMYSSGMVHGTGTSSVIKTVIDNWYAQNLMDYSSYIDNNSGFCGDRTPTTGTGLGKVYTEYVTYSRLNYNPTFTCANNQDLYTTKDADVGNKALTYPIGLISADEAIYAGGSGQNEMYFLYTGQSYWTMTPFFINANSGGAIMFTILNFGDVSYAENISYSYGVRPVINLRADITLSGSGTATDPYTIS